MSDQKQQPDEGLVIAKAEGRDLKEIAITTYRGNKYLSIRKRWKGDDGQFVFPGKTINLNYDDVQELIDSLKKNKIDSPEALLIALENDKD